MALSVGRRGVLGGRWVACGEPCALLWCGVVWCGVVLYGLVWSGAEADAETAA